MSISGDFIGFTYRGFHSSELNILRVSEGDRYKEDSSSPIIDQSIAVPGGDGAYLFGTTFGPRLFNISIAFDNLSENDLYNLKVIFNDQRGGELIFDEAPYKIYSVKPSQPLSLTYVCFNQGDNNRIYKGEGTISLIAYSPFARSRYKYIEDYTAEKIPEWKKSKNDTTSTGNLSEWLLSSGIAAQGDRDIYSNGLFKLWNPGVKETDFLLKIPFVNNEIPAFELSIKNDLERRLVTSLMEKQGNDWGVQINSKLNLIEGITQTGLITGTIYNKNHITGFFFKIPLLNSEMLIAPGIGNITIDYHYIYY